MQIFLFLLIPLIGTLLAIFFFKKEYQQKTILINGVITIIISAIAILIVKSVSISNAEADTEYWGYYYIKAQRYEAYTTWVDKLCYRTETYTCGTDSKGNAETCTREVSYDCSYCDEHSEYYIAYDNNGKQHDISRELYYLLLKKWNINEIFHELNRDIEYNFSCGKDGDMYQINWNGDEKSAHSITVEKTYTNKLQAAHTIYDFADISDELADTLHLYKYPSIDKYQQQTAIIGCDMRGFVTPNEYDSWYNQLLYINGSLGNWKQSKVFLLFYPNTSTEDIAIQQQSYWKGGNKNEMCICIGYNSYSGKLNWVRCFSWCENKRIEVELREDIMELNTLNGNLFKLNDIIKHDIIKYFNRRHFKQFNYITVELPKKAYTISLILVLVFSMISVIITYNMMSNKYRY